MYLNSFSYNLKLSKIFGIQPAVLIECLSDEYYYQFRNNHLNDNNTIALSRSEIYERTSLGDAEQVDAEVSLSSCNIITIKPLQNIPNKNYYIINFNNLSNILNADDPTKILSTAVSEQFVRHKRIEPASKRQTHIASLKKKISVQDPVIQDYLVKWIDAVYSNPKGFLSPTGVVFAQQELLEYAKDNQEKQIKVLKEAIKGGYRDMTWAIQKYEEVNGVGTKNFASYTDNVASQTQASSEVF